MNRRIQFFLNYLPGPKQSCKTGKGRAWTPKRVTDDADNLSALVAPYVPDKPLKKDGVVLAVVVHYPYRASEPKKNQGDDIPKDTSPDCDNLLKQLKDVFERMGFVTNDGQFFCVLILKVWSESPGLDVYMEEVDKASWRPTVAEALDLITKEK